MTPQQEYALGQAMLIHEKGIDRSYMAINSGVYYQRPFPNRTEPAKRIMNWIYDQPEGSTFLLAEINKQFRHSTVHNAMKKLEACNGEFLLVQQQRVILRSTPSATTIA